jgi:hypothetical protein
MSRRPKSSPWGQRTSRLGESPTGRERTFLHVTVRTIEASEMTPGVGTTVTPTTRSHSTRSKAARITHLQQVRRAADLGVCANGSRSYCSAARSQQRLVTSWGTDTRC